MLLGASEAPAEDAAEIRLREAQQAEQMQADSGESLVDSAVDAPSITTIAQAPAAAVEEDRPRPSPRPNVPPPSMEERVVTADDTAAMSDFDAADSATGFGAADLDALGALSVADIGKYTPNLEIVTTGATTPTFFIRGVGLNDFNPNAAGSVAIYQDDVAINAPALQLGTLFDMEGVNVLRGPMGTGPNRNASAGAIKLYSRKPTGRVGGYLRSSFGKFMYRDFEGAVEAPVYEDLISARVAFRVTARDGYVTNLCGGKNNPALTTSYCGEDLINGLSPIPDGLPDKTNNRDNWAARATLRLLPTLDMDWLLNVHGSQRDELAFQGISYGTLPLSNTSGNILGGRDGGNYLRPAARTMRQDLNAVLTQSLSVQCPTCTPAQIRVAAREQSNSLVANEIGANLDNDPYTGAYNRPGVTQIQTLGTYLNGTIMLPNEIEFKTVTGYDQYDRSLDSDTDQSPNLLFEIGTDDKGWQLFQDIGLEGALPNDWKGSWQAGGHYLMENLEVKAANQFPQRLVGTVGTRDYTQEIWSFAVWQKLDWSFWDDFTLDGGVRYNWERKYIDYLLIRITQLRATQVEETRSAPTADVRLTYHFRENIRSYWKYSRGWKGGHFNATSPLRAASGIDPTPQLDYAEPETNNAFETGLSGGWFDNRVLLDLSLFHYNYTNYQLFTVKNQAGAPPEFVVINASDVQVYGAEANLSGRPWDNSRVEARFGWLESSFIDYVQIQSVRRFVGNAANAIIVESELNYSGNRLLNSPQFKLSLTGEQSIPLGRYGMFTLRYDASWSDTSYFDATEGRGLPNDNGEYFLPENTIGQEPYWVHNLLVRYRPPVGNLEIEGWVRNLTGQVYKSFAFDATQFQDTTIYFVGEPRTWGMTLIVNF
jgi:iron complex outermembrane receptor protein